MSKAIELSNWLHDTALNCGDVHWENAQDAVDLLRRLDTENQRLRELLADVYQQAKRRHDLTPSLRDRIRDELKGGE